MTATTRLIHVPGPAGDLAVDDGGSGSPPVVFVHAFAGTTGHWSSQLDHVRTRHRALALDLRGHGRSALPQAGDYSPGSLAGDIVAVADHLGLERFVLVGHSMGASVALAGAARVPNRVAGLMLVDPGPHFTDPPPELRQYLRVIEAGDLQEVLAEVERYWRQIGGPDPAVLERLLRELHATPRETLLGASRTGDFDPLAALASYPGPILSVVTPFNDQPASLHRLGSGFPHRVIEGTGHWIQLNRPQEFNAVLDDFLAEVAR